MRNIVKHVLDWMIVLKIEDDYIQKQIEAERQIAEQRRAELDAIRDARLSAADREYARARRIGDRILRDSEECLAEYGYYNFKHDHVNDRTYYCTNAQHIAYKDSRCQRSGVVIKCTGYTTWGKSPNFPAHPDFYDIEIRKPLVIGAYCDCDICAPFVGANAPYVLEDPPEEWVKTAFWHKGQIFREELQCQPST